MTLPFDSKQVLLYSSLYWTTFRMLGLAGVDSRNITGPIWDIGSIVLLLIPCTLGLEKG